MSRAGNALVVAIAAALAILVVNGGQDDAVLQAIATPTFILFGVILWILNAARG